MKPWTRLDRKTTMRPNWDEVRLEYLDRALRAKFFGLGKQQGNTTVAAASAGATASSGDSGSGSGSGAGIADTVSKAQRASQQMQQQKDQEEVNPPSPGAQAGKLGPNRNSLRTAGQ